MVARQATAVATAGLEQLQAWAKSKGVDTSKVQISTDLASGQAILVAAKDLGAGEAVLSVSDANWLSVEAVKRSKIGKAVEGLEPWVQIALLLVHERFVAPSQEWGAYASALPATPRGPLFWNEQQLAMVKGTQLMESLQGYKAFFQSRYTQLFGPQGALSAQSSLFPPSAFSYANFLWAVAHVRAHAHAPLEGDDLALVPLADEVAHRRAGNMAWKGKAAGFFGKGRSLVVEATRAVRKGEALSMDYAPGKLDNAVLLDYGVMDRATPKPGYALTLTLPQADRNIDDKLDIAEQAGLGPSMTFTLSPGAPPPTEMMGYLRLMQLQGGDVFLLEALFRNDVWGFMCEPVSEDNEKAVCTSMIEGAREVLTSYPASIDEDLALMRAGTLAPGSPEEQAVAVRLGEAEALDAASQWFEDRAASLKRLAYYQERRLRRLGLIDDEGRTTYDSFFKDGIA